MADHSLLTVHRIPCLTVRPRQLVLLTTPCSVLCTKDVPCLEGKLSGLQDNYVWVLQEPSGKCAVVDPSEAEPVLAHLKELGLTPSYILNTHHHWDHTGARRTATHRAVFAPCLRVLARAGLPILACCDMRTGVLQAPRLVRRAGYKAN